MKNLSSFIFFSFLLQAAFCQVRKPGDSKKLMARDSLTHKLEHHDENVLPGMVPTSLLTTIAGLRAATAPATASWYYSTDLGQEGFWYWDAGSTASDNTGTIIKARGMPTGRFIRIFNGKLNILWFGAVGDGVADNSVAIKKALAAAAGYAYKFSFGNLPATAEPNAAELYFPAGIFNVSSDKCFTDIGLTGRLQGIKITGAGNQKTRIRLVSGGSEKWFFDNYNKGAAPFKSWKALTIEDISFEGDDRTRCNFMRIWSDGQSDKEHNLIRCIFKDLNIVCETKGTGNADLTNWTKCQFEGIWGHIMSLNNPESVVHSFDNCYTGGTLCSAMFESLGGGCVLWQGGSIINGYSASHSLNGIFRTGDQYIVKTTGTSEGNNRFTFSNVRFEMPSELAKLVFASNVGTSSTSRVTFDKCSWAGIVGGNREVVFIRGNQLVEFLNSQLPTSDTLFKYRLSSTESDLYNSLTPTVKFINCEIPVFKASQVVLDGGAITAGKIIATGSFQQKFQNQDFSTAYAMDFTYPANAGFGKKDFAPVLHRVLLFSGGNYWPYNGGWESVAVLPDGATLMNITVNKESSGNDASPYQLFVGNNDKSKTYGASALGTFDGTHRIILKDMFINVGTDINKKVVRLWSRHTGKAAAQHKGWAIIEYY